MVKRFINVVAFIAFSGLLPFSTRGESTHLGSFPRSGSDGYATTFRVWAGAATSVYVAGTFNGWNPQAHALRHTSNGIWEATVPGARPGHLYKYVMNGTHWKRDPRSGRVVHAGNTDSIIYDQNAFSWGSTNFVLPPADELVVYELHAGTFYDPRPETPGSASLDDARAKLDHIASLGANAILLMPVTEFPGTHSWGYNPTDIYAVDNLTYGGPDALKRFVDAAHQRGLAVLLDVVHNHYGTSDLPGDLEHSLWNFDGTATHGGGIYFYQDPAFAMTRWGPRPDYSRPEVRDFIKDNIRMWLTDFRIDGFRWDATKFMRLTDDEQTAIPDGISLIQEINDLIRTEFTNKISVAEDLSQRDDITAPTSAGGLGFDSDWHSGFHHAITEEIARGESMNIWRVADAIRYAHHTRRTIYTESHDEAGHPLLGQVRVPVTMDPTQPEGLIARRKTLLAAGLLMTAPGIPMLLQGQEFLTTQTFHDVHAIDWSRANQFPGIAAFFRDAIHLRRNIGKQTSALRDAPVHIDTQFLPGSGHIMTMHRSGSNGPEDDVLVVANFTAQQFVQLPVIWPATGTWHAVLNSDHRIYSPDFGDTGTATCDVGPSRVQNITIAPWSLMVFSRTPPPMSFDQMHIALHQQDAISHHEMIKNGQHRWFADLVITNTNAAFAFTETVGGGVRWGAGALYNRNGWLEGETVPRSDSVPFDWSGVDPGMYRFTFNAVAGTFVIRRLVTPPPAAKHDQVAVAGNFNQYNVSAFMTPATNGTWTSEVVIQQTEDVRFKFTAYGTMQASWGAIALTHTGFPARGRAIAGISSDIQIPGPVYGRYRFTFNDRTLEYSVERIGPPRDFEGMAIAGNFNRWSIHPNMIKTGPHRWVFTSSISYPGAVEFKFAADRSWQHNWGQARIAAVVNDAILPVLPGGGNITMPGPVDGVFTITFNSDTLEYSIDRTSDTPPAIRNSMAFAGNFNGWSIAPDMWLNEANEWTMERRFRAPGEIRFKFVAENSWALSWGDETGALRTSASGVATGSGDISQWINEPGVYRIVFNDRNLTYRIERVNRVIRLAHMMNRESESRQTLLWPSVAGAEYAVYMTTNLLDGFDLVADGLAATPPENIYNIMVDDDVLRFYRIEEK